MTQGPAAPVCITANGANITNAWVPRFELRVRVLDASTGVPVPGLAVETFKVGDEAQVSLAVTDDNGVLPLCIPARALLAESFDLTLALRGVTLVAEASRREHLLARRDDGARPVHRPTASGERVSAPVGPPRFHLAAPSETSPQGAGTEGDPGWGWRLCGERVTGEAASQWPEFRSHVTWRALPGAGAVPSAAPGDWAAIQRATFALSMFFPEADGNPLTVFALTAVPPVWHLPEARFCLHEGARVRINTLPQGAPFMTSRIRGSGAGCEDDGRSFGAFVPRLPTAPPPGPGLSDTQKAAWNEKKHGAKRHRLNEGELHFWRPHGGVDVAGLRAETPVFAVRSGKVVKAGTGTLLGFVVELKVDAEPGVPTRHLRYAHLARAPSLTTGQRVRAGQRLGTVGRSQTATCSPVVEYGKSSPTHLHFEVHEGAERRHVPPETLLLGSKARAHVAPWMLPAEAMPRLFPCDCEDGADNPGKNCPRRGGSTTSIESTCWAAKGSLCPYEDDE
jgi:murein DD-endopeptidase MepM/ murein hydrolase activator NlpD